MTTVYKYRIWCSTDSKYEYEWAESEPADCPADAGHTIDANKTTIVDTAGGPPTKPDGTPIFHMDAPTEKDGKPTVVMSPATIGWKTWFFGRDDDVAPPIGRGSGSNDMFFDFATGNGEEITKDLCFSEPMELHDGQACWRPVANFDLEDIIEASVVMPAASLTPNAGLGNCNLVDLGGYNLVVPAAGDGSHDVDLATAAPLIVADEDAPDGYWDVDKTTGAVTAAVTAGQGNCNLLDVEQEGFLIRNMHIGHEHGVLDIDVYKTEWMSHNWKLRIKVTKNSSGVGKVAMWVLAFRTKVSAT